MNPGVWHKISLVVLGLSVLLVLLGGPMYGMHLPGYMNPWGMMHSLGMGNYGWLPMMPGYGFAFYAAGILFLMSYVAALIAGYRTAENNKQDILFIGAVSAVGFTALFVPGGQWASLVIYLVTLILLWK